jgi:hypothetical protein
MTTESLRAFARRQGAADKSGSPGYWHGQKELGRLVTVNVGGKEMVNVEASLARLAATADPAKGHMAQVNEAQRVMHRGTVTPPALPPASPSYQPGTDNSKNATYMQAKTAREVYEAKNAQLEYEERTGKLLRADEVKSHLASKIASMREAFLQIPSRLVPILAAETDAAKIHTLLESEIVRAMALVNEGNDGRP